MHLRLNNKSVSENNNIEFRIQYRVLTKKEVNDTSIKWEEEQLKPENEMYWS